MKYLVPYDFTSISRTALDHALMFAKPTNAEVELFHIIDKEADRLEAEKKFEELLSTLNEELRKSISWKVTVGDIFEDIGKEAEAGNAQLLIMGTHGAKGLQKLFGSNAIKVITSSNTPFIVTQSKGPMEDIKRVVFPVNLARESVQILRFAKVLAKKFDAEIHLVCQPEKDEFLSHQLGNNILRARQYLQKQGVTHEVDLLRGLHSLSHEAIEYGKKNKADLFAAVHFPESLIPQFDTFSQDMITNEWGIPVLIMNGSETAGVKTNYSFISI